MGENDYDALRQKNIAERNAIFAEFFGELKKQTEDLKETQKQSHRDDYKDDDTENQPPKKRRRTIAGNEEWGHRVKLDFRKTYNTRNRVKQRRLSSGDETTSENGELVDGDSEESSNGPKLRVLFPWAKPVQRSLDLMKMGVCDVDEENESYDEDAEPSNKRSGIRVTRSEYDPDNIPSVEEITEEMLKNVAEKSTLKKYCKMHGTSCHQCRQKTIDTKTVCRSGECIGVRGQFCGPCLRGRYGESAVEALKDPNWACPPCRGLCNCSICRTRSGLRPTGILAPTVKEEGFSSVLDYLQSRETDET